MLKWVLELMYIQEIQRISALSRIKSFMLSYYNFVYRCPSECTNIYIHAGVSVCENAWRPEESSGYHLSITLSLFLSNMVFSRT